MVDARIEVFVEALSACGEDVWRESRYANDTGTCLWCSSGVLVMVPDDPTLDWYCQAKGAEALDARLRPQITEALARLAAAPAPEAAPGPDALTPATRALLDAADALREEGMNEALVRCRLIFAQAVASKYGMLPPLVQQRIDNADFDDLDRWSRRVFSAPNVMLVVV